MLGAYLQQNGLKQADVMRALRVSKAVVSEWVKGTRVPSDTKREHLAAWTGDAVPAASWQSDKEKADKAENEQRLEELRAAHDLGATGTRG